MKRSDIIQVLSQKYKDEGKSLTPRQIDQAVCFLFTTMTRALQKNNSIQFRHFGTFSMRIRNAFEGYNPQTKKKVPVAKTFLPAFKPSPTLQETLNPGLYAHRKRSSSK